MELSVEKLVYGGEGLARVASAESSRRKAVFVPFVLEGERVEAIMADERGGFSRAALQRVIAPSPLRREAPCPYFTRCGGCHYQHTTYEHQLEIKAAILHETLQRIGKLNLEAELQVHPSQPWQYRNRTRMRVRSHPEFALGYFRWGSHALLPVEECPISSPLINRAIGAVWTLGRQGHMPAEVREIEFFVDAEDRALQVTLDGPQANPPAVQQVENKIRGLLPELGNDLLKLAAVPQGTEAKSPPGSAAAPLMYTTSAASYRVSPGAFFQVNRCMVDELVGIATHGRQGGTALDLYAGVGLFAVPLAKTFERVIAVESSQTSCSDLQYNVPASVKTSCVPVEQFVRNRGGMRPDLIVVDPPRAGLGERLAGSIAELRSPRLTYVSCDPATLARDLVVLLGAGYQVEEAHLVDLFPQTFHLESVFHLARQ